MLLSDDRLYLSLQGTPRALSDIVRVASCRIVSAYKEFGPPLTRREHYQIQGM